MRSWCPAGRDDDYFCCEKCLVAPHRVCSSRYERIPRQSASTDQQSLPDRDLMINLLSTLQHHLKTRLKNDQRELITEFRHSSLPRRTRQPLTSSASHTHVQTYVPRVCCSVIRNTFLSFDRHISLILCRSHFPTHQR